MNVRDMVRAEQAELRAVLADLPDDDWDRASLCGSWKVRDAVAHLISMNQAGLVGFLQATVSIHWFNASEFHRRASRTPGELLEEFDSVMGMRGSGASSRRPRCSSSGSSTARTSTEGWGYAGKFHPIVSSSFCPAACP